MAKPAKAPPAVAIEATLDFTELPTPIATLPPELDVPVDPEAPTQPTLPAPDVSLPSELPDEAELPEVVPAADFDMFPG